MEKIFCLSLQRSGTKSFGNFARNTLGLNVCSWKESSANRLSELWYRRDIDKIFSFIESAGFQAFEDSPWWHGDLYKFLPYRYPDAKFVCLYRPASDWLGSMQRHSGDRPLGNVRRHCEIYQRSYELMKLQPIAKNLRDCKKSMTLSSTPLVYLNYHFKYHSEMKAWFELNNFSERLFMHSLYDLDWKNLLDFTGITPINEIGADYQGKHHESGKKSLIRFSNPA